MGRGGARGAEPRQGRNRIDTAPYVAPAGLIKQEGISLLSALALGHSMPALTGLAGTEAIRYRIWQTQDLPKPAHRLAFVPVCLWNTSRDRKCDLVTTIRDVGHSKRAGLRSV